MSMTASRQKAAKPATSQRVAEEEAPDSTPEETTVTGYIASYDRMSGRGVVSPDLPKNGREIHIDVGKLALLDDKFVKLEEGQKVKLFLEDDAPWAMETQPDA